LCSLIIRLKLQFVIELRWFVWYFERAYRYQSILGFENKWTRLLSSRIWAIESRCVH
jgi:hypothetical protein